MGRKGRNTLAPTTLNILPKLELAAILMYLMMLPNTRRPSITPSSSTSRLFSSRMMSDDSLAISTALSTEMPTSAAFKRRRVVDAVAHEAHHVALALQSVDDAFLVSRRELGKDAGHAGGFRQFWLAHRFDLRPEQDFVHRQPDLFADVGRDDVIVAGQNLDVHIQSMKLLQGLGGGLLGRVEEGHEPQQGQVGFVLHPIVRLVVIAGHNFDRPRPRHENLRRSDACHALLAMLVMLRLHIQHFALDLHPRAKDA